MWLCVAEQSEWTNERDRGQVGTETENEQRKKNINALKARLAGTKFNLYV